MSHENHLTSKYGNKASIVDGYTFDSRAEARRYAEVKLLEDSLAIKDLRRQVSFELLPGVKFAGAARKQPPLRYLADFTYVVDGQLVIEDVKSSGTVTAVFKLKRHLMLALLGHQIRLVL